MTPSPAISTRVGGSIKKWLASELFLTAAHKVVVEGPPEPCGYGFAGHQGGAAPERGLEPCDLDAGGVHPWCRAEDRRRLCRNLQGQ